MIPDLKANDAEGAYLNPEFAGHEKPSAIIGESGFDAVSRQAKLTVKSSGPALETAYVIYRSTGTKSKHRSREYVSQPDDVKLPGMRELAQVGEGGFTVSAAIPEGIPAYCFSIIDANGFMQYSDVLVAD